MPPRTIRLTERVPRLVRLRRADVDHLLAHHRGHVEVAPAGSTGRYRLTALGVAGDFFGKTRLMNLSLLVIAVTALVSAVAISFPLLVAMRIAAGLVAGGAGVRLGQRSRQPLPAVDG